VTSFLSSADVAAVRQSAEGLFWDECVILRYTAPEQSSGYQKFGGHYGNWDDEHEEMEVTTPCQVTIATSTQSGMAEGGDWSQLKNMIGQLLLPAGTSLSNLDRINWTKQLGDALPTPILFEVIGPPAPGLVGIVANIQLAPGG
jgi:hypothetical protein